MHFITPLAITIASFSGLALSCNTVGRVKLTNYGWPDTVPPRQPAFKCRGGQKVPTQPGDHPALGDGSIGNPYSAAISVNSAFRDCELLYVPILKKYFRVSDHCGACTRKWVDLYLMNINKFAGQKPCEDKFGTLNFDGHHALHEVIRSPGRGFATNTQALFANGRCFDKPSEGRVFPGRDGHVQCGGHNGDDVEIITAEDLDGGADAVDNSDHTFDNDPVGRHANDTEAEPPQKRIAARHFSV